MFLLLLAMIHTPDSELVRRFKEGDRSAYEEIVRRYQDKVFSIACRYMGDREVAAEVSQDVFLALYKSLANFRGDAKLSTWIYRVVVNHCKNKRLYRGRRKLNKHEPLEGTQRDEDSPKRQLADENAHADDGAHKKQARALVQQALDALDPEQRQIVIMRDIQDLDYEEISGILDLPRGTVKSRLHRARQQLAAALKRMQIGLKDVV